MEGKISEKDAAEKQMLQQRVKDMYKCIRVLRDHVEKEFFPGITVLVIEKEILATHKVLENL